MQVYGDPYPRDHDKVHHKLQRVPKHVNDSHAATLDTDAGSGAHIQEQGHQGRRDKDPSDDLRLPQEVAEGRAVLDSSGLAELPSDLAEECGTVLEAHSCQDFVGDWYLLHGGLPLLDQ